MHLLPAKIQYLFWNYDISKLDIKRYGPFIIERILEKGTFHEVKWILRTYSSNLIIYVVENSRNLSI